MTTFSPSPFVVRTCEETASGSLGRPLAPARPGEPLTNFRVHDPLGLRKAIVPLFRVQEGEFTGLGTAFAVDPWGMFLTADHLVHTARHGAKPIAVEDAAHGFRANRRFESDGHGLTLLLGMGLSYGTPPVPRNRVAEIRDFSTPAADEPDAQVALLLGRPDLRPVDFARVRITPPSDPNVIGTLPFKSHPNGPQVGDVVVAVGYPEMNFRTSLDRARTIITEGMLAGYGRVTRLLPQGRDASLATPVFEVEANWPDGMSGGPVFNADGEVIGLVSRGIDPERGQSLGLAWATWFEAFPHLYAWLPTLTIEPHSRSLWAVRDPASGQTFMPYFCLQQYAEQQARALGPNFDTTPVSWRIGQPGMVIALGWDESPNWPTAPRP